MSDKDIHGSSGASDSCSDTEFSRFDVAELYMAPTMREEAHQHDSEFQPHDSVKQIHGIVDNYSALLPTKDVIQERQDDVDRNAYLERYHQAVADMQFRGFLDRMICFILDLWLILMITSVLFVPFRNILVHWYEASALLGTEAPMKVHRVTAATDIYFGDVVVWLTDQRVVPSHSLTQKVDKVIVGLGQTAYFNSSPEPDVPDAFIGSPKIIATSLPRYGNDMGLGYSVHPANKTKPNFVTKAVLTCSLSWDNAMWYILYDVISMTMQTSEVQILPPGVNVSIQAILKTQDKEAITHTGFKTMFRTILSRMMKRNATTSLFDPISKSYLTLSTRVNEDTPTFTKVIDTSDSYNRNSGTRFDKEKSNDFLDDGLGNGSYRGEWMDIPGNRESLLLDSNKDVGSIIGYPCVEKRVQDTACCMVFVNRDYNLTKPVYYGHGETNESRKLAKEGPTYNYELGMTVPIAFGCPSSGYWTNGRNLFITDSQPAFVFQIDIPENKLTLLKKLSFAHSDVKSSNKYGYTVFSQLMYQRYVYDNLISVQPKLVKISPFPANVNQSLQRGRILAMATVMWPGSIGTTDKFPSSMNSQQQDTVDEVKTYFLFLKENQPSHVSCMTIELSAPFKNMTIMRSANPHLVANSDITGWPNVFEALPKKPLHRPSNIDSVHLLEIPSTTDIVWVGIFSIDGGSSRRLLWMTFSSDRAFDAVNKMFPIVQESSSWRREKFAGDFDTMIMTQELDWAGIAVEETGDFSAKLAWSSIFGRFGSGGAHIFSTPLPISSAWFNNDSGGGVSLKLWIGVPNSAKILSELYGTSGKQNADIGTYPNGYIPEDEDSIRLVELTLTKVWDRMNLNDSRAALATSLVAGIAVSLHHKSIWSGRERRAAYLSWPSWSDLDKRTVSLIARAGEDLNLIVSGDFTNLMGLVPGQSCLAGPSGTIVFKTNTSAPGTVGYARSSTTLFVSVPLAFPNKTS